MKIVKRKCMPNPISSMVIWVMPTMTYFLGKIGGMFVYHKEWVWWIFLPVMFFGWFFINFKVKK